MERRDRARSKTIQNDTPKAEKIQRASSLRTRSTDLDEHRKSTLPRKKIPIISTPFTSSRYSQSYSQPYNLVSPRGSKNKTSISSRLAEVKKLVDAGFVKQEVYDKLVGANKKNLQPSGTTSDNEEEQQEEEEDTNQDNSNSTNNFKSNNSETKDDLVPIPRCESSSILSLASNTNAKQHGKSSSLNNFEQFPRKSKPTRHQSRHTIHDVSQLVPETTSIPSTTTTSKGKHRTRGSIVGLQKMFSFISRTKSLKKISEAGSPLDMPVVSNDMLNYKVTMINTPEKTADATGSIYTLFVMLVTYEEDEDEDDDVSIGSFDNPLFEDENENENEDNTNNKRQQKEEWVIRRRYRVFNDLHSQIRKILNGTPLLKSLPKFPAKTGFTQLITGPSEEFLIKRMSELEAYMEGLICLSTRNVQSSKMLKEFLHAPDIVYTGEDETQQSQVKISSEMTMSPFRASHANSGGATNSMRIVIDLPKDDNEKEHNKDQEKNANEQSDTIEQNNVYITGKPSGGKKSITNSPNSKSPSLSSSSSPSPSLVNSLSSTSNTFQSTFNQRISTSPTPDVPPRPKSHEARNAQLTPKPNSNSKSKSKSMAQHAAAAAANTIKLVENKKTMVEPIRKLVQGRDGCYRWQYRKDIAPLQHYLFKRGGFRGGNKNWKRRWIVLKDFAIFYYRTSKPVLLGTINLDVTTTIDVLQSGAASATTSSSELSRRPQGVPLTSYCFIINTSNRSLYVYAEKKEIGEEWTRVIREQVTIMQEMQQTKERMEQERLETAARITVAATAQETLRHINSMRFIPPPMLPPAPPEMNIQKEKETKEQKDNDATINSIPLPIQETLKASETSETSETSKTIISNIEEEKVQLPPRRRVSFHASTNSSSKDTDNNNNNNNITTTTTTTTTANDTNDTNNNTNDIQTDNSSNPSSTGSFIVLPLNNLHSKSSSISSNTSLSPTLKQTKSSSHNRSQSSGDIPKSLSSDKRAAIAHVSRSHWELDFDQLTFGGELGKGAYGVVHQGTLWGTDVAIKRLNTQGFSFNDNDSQSKKMRKQILIDLKSEVKILSELRHPNVVLYIGVCTEIPNICIVTELCPRRSLFDIIHDPSVALSCELRLRMALQAAQGMAYLHNQDNRIIHRDLKSHNLLVGENFDIKVADFGLTVVRQSDDRYKSLNSFNALNSNGGIQVELEKNKNGKNNDRLSMGSSIGGNYGVHGTPQWMAPEVMEGSPYNGKVDVYSYGIVLCEIFSRVLPFSDRYRAFEFIEAVLEQGATPTIPRWCHQKCGDKDQNKDKKEEAAAARRGNKTHRARDDTQTLSRAIPHDWASFDWTSSMGAEDEEDEDSKDQLELPDAIQSLRRGTLRKVIIQCLDRDPKQRPSFDLLVAALRNVLMPTNTNANTANTANTAATGTSTTSTPTTIQEDWGMGPRVFLEFDLPRIVETLRDSTYLLSRAPGEEKKKQGGMQMTSVLLHGAAVCREVDDVFTAMCQPDPLRGIPMCSDDHRYMCLQPSPFPLAHPLATQVVCLLAQYLVGLLDAVTGWISQNSMIAASYEPVSILWDVLGALEATVRMQDPQINRAHTRALYYDRTHRNRRHRRSSSISGTKDGSTVKTAVVLDVLRNAGLVASIIALFALLPEDPSLLPSLTSDKKNDLELSNSSNSSNPADSSDSPTTPNYDSNDDNEIVEADEDETMLRDQLCKSAHLGGTVLQMLSRLDAECVSDTKVVIEDSLDELMEIPEELLAPLERRFSKYLGHIVLPDTLVARFNQLHENK